MCLQMLVIQMLTVIHQSCTEAEMRILFLAFQLGNSRQKLKQILVENDDHSIAPLSATFTVSFAIYLFLQLLQVQMILKMTLKTYIVLP